MDEEHLKKHEETMEEKEKENQNETTDELPRNIPQELGALKGSRSNSPSMEDVETGGRNKRGYYECGNGRWEKEERMSEKEENNNIEDDVDDEESKGDNEDKEEGELEEGELEDEEEVERGDYEEEEREEPKNRKEMKSEETNEKEQNKENRDTSRNEKNKDLNREISESKEKSSKEERKRKHREFEEDKRKKKKRKHHHSSEDEEGQKKKFPPAREKPYDFDTLLKQEMYLVGSAPNLEGGAFLPDEEQYKGPPFQGHVQYKRPNDGESYESGSGGEWEEKPRKRTKRKRRGSRSPSRKNEAVCMFYLQGSCKRGSECPYSHEIAPTRKMELCKFYMMDCCAKKEKCLYMHKDFPCKYFHFGMKCKAGDLCKFSHDPLQEITRNILLKHIELAPKDILGDFPRVLKHNAQIILSVTEAKRRGEPVDLDSLEPVLDLEGKGFKYLDRALKNIRKKKDGEKKGEKEDKERISKKSKNRDDYRDLEKEREKEGGGGRDKERERNRERDKDRERNRDKGRHRSKGDYGSHMSQKQREFYHRTEQQQHSTLDEGRDREGHGRSFDTRNTPAGMLNHSMDPGTKWYSSDEEGDTNDTQGFRRNQNYGSPQERRHRSGDGPQGPSQICHQGPFPGQSNLPDIDVSYLKNVLNAVQNQSSQNSMQPSHGNQDSRGTTATTTTDNWEPRSNKYPTRENRPSVNNYMDIANDIKEVFYDSSDPKDDFARNVDTLIKNARGKTSSDEKEFRDEFREGRRFNVRNFRDSFQGQLDSVWNQGNSGRGREGREEPMNPRDIPQGYRGEGIDERNFGRDPRHSRETYNTWENEREPPDAREELNDSKYMKSSFEYQEGGRNVKGDTDLRLLHSANNRLSESAGTELKISNRNSGGDRLVNSIYDFDFRQLENIKISSDSEGGLNSLPFKVPMHSSAKELDASINSHAPVYYQLIRVDIPKPDFSRLKINPDDPKTLDDPRLRKMLRRNSTDDSSMSPRSKYEGEASLASPTFESKLKFEGKFSDGDSRDPRKMPSRDPRAEAKGMNRMEARTDPRPDPRIDPRMMNRSDPRSDPRTDSRPLNTRVDPRMDNRDPRMDPRDSMLDSDMRDSDPRIGGPVFVNGMMEGPGYPHFPNMGGLSNPIMQQGIDPRGRPGLLGPAPAPGPKGIPMGLPGQLPQGLGTNPFLLPQGIGGPPGPFMSGDRGDMIGGSGPSFPPSQWSGGGRVNFTDPRLSRDMDMGSFAPSSVS